MLDDRRGEGWMRARLAGVLATLGRIDEAQSLRTAARAIAESEKDDRLRKIVGD